MTPSEALLTQLDKIVGNLAEDISLTIRLRRTPSDATMIAWIRRLRKAADALEGRLHGS